MRVTAVFLVTSLFVATVVRAQTPALMDLAVAEGKDAMYRLQYGVAEEIFGRIIEEHPDSPVGYGMMSVLAWNELLVSASNLVLHEYGTPTPYIEQEIHKPIAQESQRFHATNDRLLAVCERILDEDPENVLALYFQGLAYENLAAEALTIGRDRWDAVGPGRKANGIHEAVLRLDPDFVDAQVSVAAYKYALATVPAFARAILWVPRLFGFFRGTKDEAFALMESVGQSGKYRNQDAWVVLSVMQAFGGDPRQAVLILQDLARLYPQNYMIDLNMAAIQEFNIRDSMAALSTYQSLLEALPAKTAGLGEGEVRFRMGKAYFGLGDYGGARTAFERAIDSPSVEAETKPLSYFYLGMTQSKQGSISEARESYRRVVALAASMESLEDEVETAREELR